jgi:acyl-CoA thioesterase FadM
MQKNFLVAFGIGLAIIALAVGGIFFMQRGDRMELPGKILKVRTAPLDDDSSIAVIDFRITNPSNILFEVRTVTVEMDDNQGRSYLGQPVSEVDAIRLFEGLPVLGQKFNPTLIMRERLGSHRSADRMIAARFQAPMALLDRRKRFVVRIEEVDGKSFEYAER